MGAASGDGGHGQDGNRLGNNARDGAGHQGMKGGRREGAGRPPGRAIIEDARAEILRRYLEGEPVGNVEERFGVSPSYPTILVKRRGVQRKMKAEPSPALEAAPEPNIPVVETAAERLHAWHREALARLLSPQCCAYPTRCSRFWQFDDSDRWEHGLVQCVLWREIW